MIMFNANDVMLYCNKIVNFDIDVSLPSVLRQKQEAIIPSVKDEHHYNPAIQRAKLDADFNLQIISYVKRFKDAKISKKVLEHADNYKTALNSQSFHKIMTLLSGVEQMSLF